jgi:pimeloyl-ACP methyl ester carboxylesterase
LAQEGISTLRIEKREVTESKNAAIVKSGCRIEDMVEDAVRWLRFLKADKRFSKIAVIGHGEGALVGMLASEIADVKYYVSITGYGKPGYQVVEENLTAQLTPEQMDTARVYIEEMKKGNVLENVEPSLASIFNSVIQPYLISWFKYDPATELANLNARVLLVQGSDDTQVDSDDLARLTSAYPEAEKQLIDGMNHALKKVKKKEKHQDKACDLSALPLANGLVDGIADFLKNNDK